MSYRCNVCSSVVPRGQPRRTQPVYRTVQGRREIERELAVCETCAASLAAGMPLAELYRHHRPQVPEPPVIPGERPPATGSASPVSLPATRPLDPQALLSTRRRKQPTLTPTTQRQPRKKGL